MKKIIFEFDMNENLDSLVRRFELLESIATSNDDHALDLIYEIWKRTNNGDRRKRSTAERKQRAEFFELPSYKCVSR